MKSKILNHIFIIIFVIFFQIPLIIENEMKNLEENYGVVTLYFGSNGKKTLYNGDSYSSSNIRFYLKSGDNLK